MQSLNPLSANYRKIHTLPNSIVQEAGEDGSFLMWSSFPLEAYPTRMTERLHSWAEKKPEQTFLAQRDDQGAWQKITYLQAYTKVRILAQALLNRGLNQQTPIAILSENSLEHALLALAALHVGIPHAPIAPAYALRSNDFGKLRHCLTLLEPSLIFVSDYQQYAPALEAVADGIEVVAVKNAPEKSKVTPFSELLKTAPSAVVEEAFEKISPDTIAKILFTSGSTAQPKGVINTHGNVCANWQQITQTFPFMAKRFEIIDWLPWNHTFGGNHNLGLTLYNGGSMYIDDGNPTPKGIETTVANLREMTPNIYFNVPKGFEELVHYFRKEPDLCQHFFSHVQLLFYAGAGLAPKVWNELEALALESVGEKIVMSTGLGCTEASPSAMFQQQAGGFPGLLGIPVPGLELKLVPKEGKLEARYRGPNITPGYWRNPDANAQAFDDQGFYCSGDALKLYEPGNPNAGLIFDGRISEDFKLDTGTWVSVGNLRANLVTSSHGLIQDAVITGHDRPFVGAILFPDLKHCRELADLPAEATLGDIIQAPGVQTALYQVLLELGESRTGGASFVQRAVLAPFVPSIDTGEMTDKGSLNQRMILQNHADLVELLYREQLEDTVIEIH